MPILGGYKVELEGGCVVAARDLVGNALTAGTGPRLEVRDGYIVFAEDPEGKSNWSADAPPVERLGAWRGSLKYRRAATHALVLGAALVSMSLTGASALTNPVQQQHIGTLRPGPGWGHHRCAGGPPLRWPGRNRRSRRPPRSLPQTPGPSPSPTPRRTPGQGPPNHRRKRMVLPLGLLHLVGGQQEEHPVGRQCDRLVPKRARNGVRRGLDTEGGRCHGDSRKQRGSRGLRRVG